MTKQTPFKHTKSEMVILNCAHGDMMARLSTGQHYDVVRLAWVDAEGNVIRDDRAWLNATNVTATR